jgi:hypothetical protein
MSAGSFGPWRPDLSPSERVAAFRELRALCLAHLGRSHDIVPLLKTAETDPGAATRALAAFEGLPPLPQRRILSSLLDLSRWSQA